MIELPSHNLKSSSPNIIKKPNIDKLIMLAIFTPNELILFISISLSSALSSDALGFTPL